MPDSPKPDLTVIMLGYTSTPNLMKVLDLLGTQDVPGGLDLIIVTPSKPRLGLETVTGPSLARVRIIEVRDLAGVGQAKAVGVRAAETPFIVFCEDHSYPGPGWAKALLECHRQGDWAAVGPAVTNANPLSRVGWGLFLAFYGAWMASGRSGEVDHLPGNHSCYRRELLLGYGARLEEMLDSESLLHWDLIDRGYKLLLCQEAVARHLNYSRLEPLLRECFFSSRVFAHLRTKDRSFFRRLVYTLGSPLIPLFRLRRLRREMDQARLRPAAFWRSFPVLILNLLAGAAGEMMGYGLGPGRARKHLMLVEAVRASKLTDDDLAAIAGF